MSEQTNQLERKQLLDLFEDEKQERPYVKMTDGQEYQMLLPSEFDIPQQLQIQRLQKRMQSVTAAIENADMNAEVTDEEVTELREASKRIVRLLMPDVPPAVLDELSDVKRQRILAHFASFIRAAQNIDEAPQPAGPQPSQNSNVSTAARRNRG